MHRPAMAHEQHVDTGDLASRYMVGEFGVHRDQCGIRGVRTEWSLHSGSPMANAPLSDGGSGDLRASRNWSNICAWTSRSEEHTSELQSLMRISYAVFCLTKKKNTKNNKKLILH